MSVPRHLGEQFADILQGVNDTFDIEYGDNPSMAKIGGLHVPVSMGKIASVGGQRFMQLHVPHERGEMWDLFLEPEGEDGPVFFGQRMNYNDNRTEDPEKFNQKYANPSPAHEEDLSMYARDPADILKKDAEDTLGGRLMVAGTYAPPAPGRRSSALAFYHFDPKTRSIAGDGPFRVLD